MAGHRIIPPFSAVLLMVALSVVGIVSLPRLKVQYAPSTQGRSLQVSYSLPDASPEIVEAEVTSRIEGVLSGIRSVTDVESNSWKGGGSVSLTFRRGTDLEAARFEMASAIRNVYSSLPKGLTYPSISRSGGSGRGQTALVYTLKGPMPSQEIERYARERLLSPLSALKDVDRVSLTGATPFHWVITFDAEKAYSAGISASEIATAFRNARSGALLGMTRTPDGLMAVRLDGDLSDDFGAIPVKNVGGHVVFLRDLATWQYKESEPQSYYRVNGLNTINLSVGLVEGANLLAAVDAIQARMASLQTVFPDEITASVSYDSSEYVRDELKRIYFRTGLCLLILLLFVFIVSRSWRYVLIVSATLAVNILTAIAIYAFAGLPIHIYTLAGITVSLGIVIDTSIVMIDHYRYWLDRRVFPSLVAATATTIGALLTVLLLPENERANLTDFIWVIVINLALSLAVAWLFIPSLMSFLPLRAFSGQKALQTRRRAVRFNHAYASYIDWGVRHRWILLLVAAAGFAWPAYRFSKIIDRSAFYRQPERKQLYIRAGMPEGCTVAQLNDVVKSMENYLAGFDGIETFTTQISSFDNAEIIVTFTPEAERTGFPLQLKGQVTGMAINFGGATWQVYGIDENGFNNNVLSSYKSNRISLTGYQYQDLVRYAEMVIERLSRNRRVSAPEIWSGRASSRPRTEFNLDYDFGRMMAAGIDPYAYYGVLASRLWESDAGSVVKDGILTDVVLRSSEADSYDLWHVLNAPVDVDSLKVTLSRMGSIEKHFTGRDIRRFNQSYQLDVCFDFIGSFELAKRTTEDAVNYMNNEVLPVGFKAESNLGGWFDNHKDRYFWLLGLILAVLVVMLSVTFESLRLPWPVLGMIPVSYIGLFLVFCFSTLSFDQGGFAALVMLSGIVVNAGIYLTTTWQRFGGPSAASGRESIRLYVKSFSHKIVPIFLTILSTVLGLLPFLSDGPEEVFWFDFAAGTIGGMIFSVLALVFFFPPMLVRSERKSR